MEPLAPVNSKKSAPVTGGFDSFDDILDAPTRPVKKSSKGKSKKKKKGSSKKKMDMEQSLDNVDMPLSPDFGDSLDREAFAGLEAPKNIGASDLEDSILGLLGGPEPSKGLTRPRTTASAGHATEDKPSTRPSTGGPRSTKYADDEVNSAAPTYSARREADAEANPTPMTAHDPEMSLDLDIDSLLPNDAGSMDVSRPLTHPGRRRPVRDWTADEDTPSARTNTGGNSTGMQDGGLLDGEEGALAGTAPLAPSRSTRPSTGRPTTSSAVPATAPMTDDMDDFDFDVDALLPESAPLRPSKSAPGPTASSSSNTHMVRSHSQGSETEVPGPLPGISRSRSGSRSASPDKHADSDAHNPLKTTENEATEKSGVESKNNEDDVDIGFMPSFLETGREGRGRRQLGRGRTARPRSSGEGTSGELDALDKALGIGGPGGNTVGKAAGGRVVKAVDPFSHADTAAHELKAQRPSADQVNRTDSYRPVHSTAPISTTSVPTDSKPAETTTAPDNSPANTTPVSNKKAPHTELTRDISASSNVSLPSLTPVKSYHPAQASGATSSSTLDSQEHRERPNSSEQPKTPKRRSSAGSATNTPTTPKHASGLNIRVDESHDSSSLHAPTTPKSTSDNREREAVHHAQKSPTGRGSSVSFAISPTHASGNTGNTTPGSAKRILKKSSSSYEIAPVSSVPGGKPQYSSTSPSTSGSGKKRDSHQNLSMPSWLSPNASVDLSGSTTSPGKSRDTTVRQLQQKIEELSIQKDTIEKYLRLEIESLKGRLESSASAGSGGATGDALSSSRTEEVEDLKMRLKAALEENARLKEESVIEKIRHQKEINHLRERHQADMDAGNLSKSEEIALLERRHTDAITALKKIHNDELNAVKQRAKDGVALDHLSSQISTTTGSLKLIEEQISQQYRGLDAVREGQFEARERLLMDMEAKARERAEAAESEGYKLKGLLSHMEQVVQNLRSQGGEERERLRMEHRRIEALQESVESERRAIQERASAEMTELRRKMSMMEEREREHTMKRAEEQADLNEMKRKLEADRKEFAAYVSSNVKAAEQGAVRLKEEENRLNRLRSEISQERNALERSKEQASADLLSAEKWRQSVSEAQDDIEREKRALRTAASELQDMSDRLVERDRELEYREKSLLERENKLEQEKSEVEYINRQLNQREQEIAATYKQAEEQRLEMQEIEDEMLRRRVMVSSQRREMSRLQLSGDNRLVLSGRLNRDGEKGSGRYYPCDEGIHDSIPSKHTAGVNGCHFPQTGKENSRPQIDSSVEEETTSNYSPIVADKTTLPQSSTVEGAKAADLFAISGIDKRVWEAEVFSAKKAMQAARGGVHRASQARLKRENFIQSENDFLSKIRRRDD